MGCPPRRADHREVRRCRPAAARYAARASSGRRRVTLRIESSQRRLSTLSPRSGPRWAAKLLRGLEQSVRSTSRAAHVVSRRRRLSVGRSRLHLEKSLQIGCELRVHAAQQLDGGSVIVALGVLAETAAAAHVGRRDARAHAEGDEGVRSIDDLVCRVEELDGLLEPARRRGARTGPGPATRSSHGGSFGAHVATRREPRSPMREFLRRPSRPVCRT